MRSVLLATVQNDSESINHVALGITFVNPHLSTERQQDYIPSCSYEDNE